MKLVYAMGGGMGHLYRAWILTQQFAFSTFKVITSNSLATRFFSEEQLLFIDPNDYVKSWERFVEQQLPKIQPEAFYIDTFPIGLVGELSLLSRHSVSLHYVARRLKWKEYEKVLQSTNIKFDSTLVLEPLEAAHADFIKNNSERIEVLQLHYPPPQPDAITVDHVPLDGKIWLVVHAFNKHEMEALLHYAQEAARLEAVQPYFLVLSDQHVNVVNGRCMYYPAVADWFPIADRIFIGAGFNSVQQVLPFLERTTMIPFPRKYDDQVWRAAHHRSNSANQEILTS